MLLPAIMMVNQDQINTREEQLLGEAVYIVLSVTASASASCCLLVGAIELAVAGARAAARVNAWSHAGLARPQAVDERRPLIIAVDGSRVSAHSDTQNAAPTFKKGLGFHPSTAFIDHGIGGTGEPLAILLRPGNAGSNTASDHIKVITQALEQLPGLPGPLRPGQAARRP